jgi:hypothetical protein
MLISPVEQGDPFDVAPGRTESCYFASINILRGSRSPIGIRLKVSRGRHSGARCLNLKKTTGPPLLLAFVDFLRDFAKLLGLFVDCL